MPDLQQALDFYPSDYTHYNPKKAGLKAFLMRLYMRRTVSFLKKLGVGKGERILDIGCAGGQKLAILSDALGLEAVGIEPNGFAARKAKELFGLKVYTDVFPSSALKGQYFDVIYINHVIEHVPDPLKLLNDIYDHLSPGGIVFGETENLDCPSFRLFGRYWALLHLPFHLFFFNRETLCKVFQNSRFDDVVCETITEPTAWSLSLHNVLMRKSDPNKPRSARMPGYIPLTLLAIPVSRLESGRGPILRFWARK
jgi:SAM-dependent methyltransferase